MPGVTIVGSKEILSPGYSIKFRSYGSTIATILGISGVILGAIGLGGYCRIGLLREMNKTVSITMIAAGGSCGAFLLIIGICCQKNRNKSVAKDEVQEQLKTDPKQIIRDRVDTQGGLVFGKDAWQVFGVEVLDEVPPIPSGIDLNRGDKFFIYIPENARVNGKETKLTLQVFKEINEKHFKFFFENIKQVYGNTTAPGWVLVDKTLNSESLGRDLREQERLPPHGSNLLQVLQAVVANLMVFEFTGKRLFGKETYTICKEHFTGLLYFSILVGNFDEAGLSVCVTNVPDKQYGAAYCKNY